MSLSTFLRVIRWKNIAMVMLTLWLIRNALKIDPSSCPIFSPFYFTLMVFAFACITAAGNMHNDIQDVEIDKINKPEALLMGNLIPIQQGLFFTALILFSGLLIIIFLAIRFDSPIWICFYLGFATILYFYNTRLKGVPLVGNIVVALMCGSVVVAPMFLGCKNFSPSFSNKMDVVNLIYAFAGMSVVANFLRELIKDMEDVAGDHKLGCRTLPVVYGLASSRTAVFVVSSVLAIALTCFFIEMMNYVAFGRLAMSLVIIVLPFILFLITFYRNKLNAYNLSQRWLKIMLLAGLLVLIGI